MTTPRSTGPPARVVMTKWGGGLHWEFPAVRLGSDAAGDWLGIPAGTTITRPGATYVAPVDQVVLVPGPDQPEPGWLATFHAEGGPVRVYVDVTTPPVWQDQDTGHPVLQAVDLDLDVVRGLTGQVWVEDEDEFAQHRATLGYPDPVVAAAQASCTWLTRALREDAAPFDGVAGAWLAQLTHVRS